MKILLESFLLLVLFFLFSIQNVQADLWADPLGELKQMWGSFEELTQDFLQSIEEYEIEKDVEKLTETGERLTQLYEQNPLTVFELSKNPKVEIFLNEYSLNELDKDLENLSELKLVGVDKYVSEVSKKWQRLGHMRMSLSYSTENDVDALKQSRGFVVNSAIILLESTPTYDLETGEITTLDKNLKKTLNQHPILKETDFADDPVRAGLMLYLDSEFIFITPIIPIRENELISVEEYCSLKLDEVRCEILKKAGMLAHMAIKKDPRLAVESIETFLIVAKDVNKETGAGYDAELAYAEFLLTLDPQDLADAKLIELPNGQFMSLNEASKYDYDGNKIIIAKSTLTYLSSDEEKIIKQLNEDTKILLEIIDDLNNRNVPQWIKNNAMWWSEGQIGDSDFLSGIQYMIKVKIINIPDLPEQESETIEKKVPNWVRNNAGWWATGQILEDDFVNGIKYLVEKGIIQV